MKRKFVALAVAGLALAGCGNFSADPSGNPPNPPTLEVFDAPSTSEVWIFCSHGFRVFINGYQGGIAAVRDESCDK